MNSHSKEKSGRYNQEYSLKIHLKRLRSKSFKNEFKKKQSERQQKCRVRKREARHLTATIFASSTTKGGLRKTEGARRRRANTAKLKNENKKLLNEVQKLQKEKCGDDEITVATTDRWK
ncbi:unnamed protein product [Didymodactylos carnosus]|uniref:Uncharacterized protein n=1 Tax=Didymodactylos carnosus TaxID=1234261 RepID=A0A8S2U845_9BILA|nr:unnamed protein product [Didymodactylos carnosus]CAF4320205.1 unnamed protein product [Didymodactylos carnosus]